MTALVVFNDQIELAKLQFGNFGFSGVTEKKTLMANYSQLK